MEKTVAQINFLHMSTPVHFLWPVSHSHLEVPGTKLGPIKGSSAKFFKDSWKSSFASSKILANSFIHHIIVLCCTVIPVSGLYCSINQRLILREFVVMLIKST